MVVRGGKNIDIEKKGKYRGNIVSMKKLVSPIPIAKIHKLKQWFKF